jgi:hypothetical protein
MTLRHALITWLLMVPIAFANGTLRQFAFAPRIGEPAAHQVSCFTAMAAFGLLIYAVTRRWHLASYGQAWTIGLLWAGATLTFETVLGLSRGVPWRDIFVDYALWKGHLWALVVAFLAIAPALSVAWDRAQA